MKRDRSRARPLARPPRWSVLPATLLCLGLSTASTTRGQAPAPPRAADPVAAEVETGRALAEFEKGQYRSAADRLGRLDRPDAGARYYRGLSFLALKDAERALQDFRAVRDQPGSPSEVQL